MHGKARPPSSALRPSEACAAELIAGGSKIAIPSKQPLGELTQDPVKEYALSASPAEIDSEETILLGWSAANHRLFPEEEITVFEKMAGPEGGGSEHDAWVVMSPEGKVVIRSTINDSYGFRFLGVSLNKRGNGVLWTVQPYIEGTHLTQAELVADLRLHGWRPAGSQHNHLVFEHAASGIRIHDVHAGNFIRRKNGDLIPIDVFFENIPQVDDFPPSP